MTITFKYQWTQLFFYIRWFDKITCGKSLGISGLQVLQNQNDLELHYKARNQMICWCVFSMARRADQIHLVSAHWNLKLMNPGRNLAPAWHAVRNTLSDFLFFFIRLGEESLAIHLSKGERTDRLKDHNFICVRHDRLSLKHCQTQSQAPTTLGDQILLNEQFIRKVINADNAFWPVERRNRFRRIFSEFEKAQWFQNKHVTYRWPTCFEITDVFRNMIPYSLFEIKTVRRGK
jgi:hypothetical protein